MEDIASGKQPIARRKLAMLPIALHNHCYSLQGRDIVRYVDNTAALGSVIKESSSQPQANY